MADKTYVGKGWKHTFANGGSVISVSLEIEKLPKPDQYGCVRLVIGQRRNPDEKSKATHWVAVDDYKKQPDKTVDDSVGF